MLGDPVSFGRRRHWCSRSASESQDSRVRWPFSGTMLPIPERARHAGSVSWSSPDPVGEAFKYQSQLYLRWPFSTEPLLLEPCIAALTLHCPAETRSSRTVAARLNVASLLRRSARAKLRLRCLQLPFVPGLKSRVFWSRRPIKIKSF